jgi:ribonuclease D
MDPIIYRNINDESTAEQTVEEYDTLIYMARCAVFIDCIDRFFNTAVQDIKKESTIGIDSKVAFGHHHEVTLLSISTQTRVYQFDILKLGMAAFENGLRSILEGKIQKVIHNSRPLASCLNHKYLVKLANVFDTQVGELIIEKNVCGEFPKYMCSLTECMKVFLGLPIDRVQFNNDDKLMWMKRPLSQSLKISAAQNAVFLLPLQKCIKTEMLSSLMQQGTNIFQKTVRDASNDEVLQHIARNYLVPREFLQLEYPDKHL